MRPVVITLLICTFLSATTSFYNQSSEFLRNRIESAGSPPFLTVNEEIIHASVMLPQFYEQRIYELAWSSEKGPRSIVKHMIQALREAEKEGLRPVDYHLEKIESTLEEIRANKDLGKAPNPRRLVDLDLLLTDAFLIYGAHLLAGRVNPQTIDAEWFANRREANLAQVLQRAIENVSVSQSLEELKPPQKGYRLLREALQRYRKMQEENSFVKIEPGPKLALGVEDGRVECLRKRLQLSADYINNDDGMERTDFFDEQLESAVKKFQQRHGLDVDGAVGQATLESLNTAPADRIRQLEANLERWRWLPQDLGKRHILVNIASFDLEVFEQNRVVLDMRVIVGKDYRRTPVFSDLMTYIVLCPYWHVPHSIAVKDKLPLIKKEPGYIVKNQMALFSGWGADALQIDPATVNWEEISARNFPYRLRQEPGPDNALGKAKFMFPNQFNVYLHDTPTRELFAKTVRTFSSGCIRIEKPLELAEHVLKGHSRYGSAEQIRRTIETWQETTVRLPEPIPVHLLYWTAWATEDGSIQFRKDVYGRDTPLLEALNEEPPAL